MLVLLAAFSLPLLVKGQGCSVCTKTAASLGEKGARGLNGGIVYLAALPLGILGTIGFVWWKHNKHDNQI